jgi:hypothetical protein
MELMGEKADCEKEGFVVPKGNHEIVDSSNNHQSQTYSQLLEHSKKREQDDGKDEEPRDPESSDVTKRPGIESFMEAASSKRLRPFVIISSSYLLFTITDGAIRMIVLLHAYNKNFSALEVSIMFTLYELAGVFTNLVGPEINARGHA